MKEMAVGMRMNWQRLALLATMALTAAALAAPAPAQDATWLANPGNETFGDSANGSPAAVPTCTAPVDASTATTISLTDITIGTRRRARGRAGSGASIVF